MVVSYFAQKWWAKYIDTSYIHQEGKIATPAVAGYSFYGMIEKYFQNNLESAGF